MRCEEFVAVAAGDARSRKSRCGCHRAASLHSLELAVYRSGVAGWVRTDVVVVGAGSAGCVVAARAAKRGRSVLLLEAGPDLRPQSPEGFRDGWGLPTGHDWGYASTSGDSVRRGRAVGGTSWWTRFAMRGAPADYDAWGAIAGGRWCFDDVLPDLRRLEADAEFADEPWHGADGPIPVTRYPKIELTAAAAAGLEAMVDAGFSLVEDHNRPGVVGVGRMPMSSHGGMRVTTADAYLPGVGLQLRTDAHVDRLVIESGRAVGVELRGGEVVGADHVVLSAGVFGSAAILMRSGIGPAEHLSSLGIRVQADLPVGEGLADHPSAYVEVDFKGVGRSAPVLHVVATFRSPGCRAEDAPDLMLWLSDPVGPPTMEIECVLLRPRGRGRVRLRSGSCEDPPVIELPQLEADDRDRLEHGLQLAIDVVSSSRLGRVGVRVQPLSAQEVLAANRYSIPHYTGTCAMGSVVDHQGAVLGTDGVTVADASIIPLAVSAFTQVPTIMLAEHLAPIIAS